MLCHVDVLIVLFFIFQRETAEHYVTCCADSKVSERLAAYPLLRSFLRGRLVVLAPFPALFRSPASARLCTCLFMLRSSNRGLMWTSRRRNRLAHCVSVAEADVRVRVRGRVVSVDVQRRQVRIVSVVTATEATHQPSVQPPYHSVKELNLTSSRLLRFAYPIWRLAWISVSTV